MNIKYTTMIADIQELFEARELELPVKDGKTNWSQVDFKVFLQTHHDIQRTARMQKKLIKFNHS